jgi:hypothetical protein
MIKSKWLALLVIFAPWFVQVQTVTSFEGIDASELQNNKLKRDVDPNGSIGTLQYMEWVNISLQAWDKATWAPVWHNSSGQSTPITAGSLWANNKNTADCAGNAIRGDGEVNFDRLASRWVVSGHSTPVRPTGKYYFCIAVSSSDDLTSTTWYTYEFLLNPYLGVNSQGTPNFPDWPKLGTWPDAYYMGLDLLDPVRFKYVGVLACALDRSNILTGGTARPIQCVKTDDGLTYLYHSLEPSDVDGTTAPPAGQDNIFVSAQAPLRTKGNTQSTLMNVWDFKLDPYWSGNSKFVRSLRKVPAFTPGCYEISDPDGTVCVPQPAMKPTGGHYLIDSLGDRLMWRLAYRNFGTYQSWLVSHTVRVGTGTSKRTGIRWYELRGTGVPDIYQTGTINPDTVIYRFMPSIAQDHDGNAAIGYSVANTSIHPSMRGSSWSLVNKTKPVEFDIWDGSGDEENSFKWGSYVSMTVDPVDDCTFWYVNQYLTQNQTQQNIIWQTKISNFKIESCSAK